MHITTGATQKPAGLPAVDQHTFILGSGDESSQRIRGAGAVAPGFVNAWR
jgi:hypothetical protein